jgi:hypothetical protein
LVGEKVRTMVGIIYIFNCVRSCKSDQVATIKQLDLEERSKLELVAFLNNYKSVATPLWAKCEDETHTPKSENLESSGTPGNSELDCRGQNTLHWGVLDIIGKALKCRCPKWPRMSHLDICSPSYGQKKGRESNWHFDSRPQKVGNRPNPDVRWGSATWRWKALEESYKIGLELVPIGDWGEKL